MATVDERIVEMRFNRSDFLRGTEETLNSLQRLEAALGGTGGISESLNKIASGFSVTGKIGFGVFGKIGAMAVETGQKISSTIMDPLINGGKKRTLNIAQANFMLKNLLSTQKEVKQVEADISYAVDGTAYGYDQAAVAAAQFVATGVKGGAQMKATLRGISGLAAMGGAEYSRVADIFTKVAGQGKVMGDDLNRVGALGINAAAELTKYFNKTKKGAKLTEKEVRKMVSNGKVDFKTFATAMDEAFGAKATKANEMYTGSLSNLKSAFARIGAEYFTIKLEEQRRVFNAIRPIINQVKNALLPMFDVYKRFVSVPFAESVERAGASIEAFMKRNIKPLGKIMSELAMIGITVRDVFFSWIGPLAQGIANVFFGKKDETWVQKTADGLEGVRKGLEGLKAGENIQRSLTKGAQMFFGAIKAVFDFLFSGIGMLGKVFGGFFNLVKMGLDYVVKGFNLLKPYIDQGIKYLLTFKQPVINFLNDMKHRIFDAGGAMDVMGRKFRNAYVQYIKPAMRDMDSFKALLRKIADLGKNKVIDAMSDVSGGLQKAGSAAAEVGENVKSIGEDVRTNIGGFFSMIAKMGSAMAMGAKEVSPDAIRAATASVSAFGETISTINQILQKMFVNVTPEQINGTITSIGKLMLAIGAFKTMQSVQGVMGSITGVFGALTEKIATFGEEAKSTSFVKVALALIGLAGALALLAMIDPKRLGGAMVAMSLMSVIAVGVLRNLATVDASGVMKAAFSLVIFASALQGVAVAATLLGLVPFPVLLQGLLATALLIMMLCMAVTTLGNAGPGVASAGLGLMALAAALTLLVIPVTILGAMSLETLMQGLLSVMALMMALVIVVQQLAPLTPQMVPIAMGLILFAAAIALLVVPIQMLGTMPFDQMITGLLALAVVIGGLALVLPALGELGEGAFNLLVAAAAITAIAFSLSLLAGLGVGGIVVALLGLAGALTIMVIAGKAATPLAPGLLALGSAFIGVGAGALMVGAALLLAAAAILLVAFAIPPLAAGFVQLASVFVQLVVASVGLLLLGVALAAFGVAAALAAIPIAALGVGMLALGIGMTLVTAFGAACAPVLVDFVKAIAPLWTEGLAIAAVATALTALGVALAALGVGMLAVGVGAVAMGVGLLLNAIAMLAFQAASDGSTAAVEKLVESMKKLEEAKTKADEFKTGLEGVTNGISAFVAVVDSSGMGVVNFGNYIKAATNNINECATSFNNAGPQFSTAMTNLVSSLDKSSEISAKVTAITTEINKLGSGINISAANATIKSSIASIVATLATSASKVKNASVTIGNSFNSTATGITNASNKSTTAVAALLAAIVAAVIAGKGNTENAIRTYISAFNSLPTGIDKAKPKAVAAAKALVTAVASAIRSNASQASNAAYTVGLNIAQGMSRGINAGKSSVTTSAKNVASTALNAAKNTLGIQSPSRRMYEVGGWFIEGFVNAVGDGNRTVERASTRVARNAYDAVVQTLDGLSDEAIGIADIVPTITPIVDTDSALASLSRLFDTVAQGETLSTALTVDRASAEDGVVAGSNTVTTVFNQYNNSPKALSSEEIYRQTRNAISRMEHA